MTKVELDKETIEIEGTDVADLNATVTPATPKNAAITFTSSNPAVATVAYKEGDNTKKVATVKAVAPGISRNSVS